MKFVGLSGGIGSGKSTVAAKLVERGAHLIDAPTCCTRELQQPGHPLFDQIVACWGAGVLDKWTAGSTARRSVASCSPTSSSSPSSR